LDWFWFFFGLGFFGSDSYRNLVDRWIGFGCSVWMLDFKTKLFCFLLHKDAMDQQDFRSNSLHAFVSSTNRLKSSANKELFVDERRKDKHSELIRNPEFTWMQREGFV
jgi:hypothetical protein